jgi:hypothetical protein
MDLGNMDKCSLLWFFIVEYYKLFQVVKDIPLLMLRNIMSINLIQKIYPSFVWGEFQM